MTYQEKQNELDTLINLHTELEDAGLHFRARCVLDRINEIEAERKVRHNVRQYRIVQQLLAWLDSAGRVGILNEELLEEFGEGVGMLLVPWMLKK